MKDLLGRAWVVLLIALFFGLLALGFVVTFKALGF